MNKFFAAASFYFYFSSNSSLRNKAKAKEFIGFMNFFKVKHLLFQKKGMEKRLQKDFIIVISVNCNTVFLFRSIQRKEKSAATERKGFNESHIFINLIMMVRLG